MNLGDEPSHPSDDVVVVCGGTGTSVIVMAAETNSTTSRSKYRRLWLRGLSISILISVKSTVVPSSSMPYVPLPPCNEHLIDIIEFKEGRKKMIQQIVKERDTYSLHQFGGVKEVAGILGSDLEHGIGGPDTQPEAEVSWNTTDYKKRPHVKLFLSFLGKACYKCSNVLLLFAAGLSFGVEMAEQKPQYGWHDGAAILLAMLLLVIFPSVGGFRRARKMEKKLRKERNEFRVNITRNGEDRQISVCDIVKGDLVHLKMGDTVPADGLFVNGEGLKVKNQVPDTEINTETNPFLCYGSEIVEGKGRMLVVGAEVGSGMVTSKDLVEKTFFEAHIDKPNSYMDSLAHTICVLIATIALFNLLMGRRQHVNDDHILPELKGKGSADTVMRIFESIFLRPRRRILILTGALTAVVIGIQHGMPFVITISLSGWIKKLESVGIKPQNLSACCTAGLVTVICFNVTGWETKIEVENFLIGDKDAQNDLNSETNLVIPQVLRRAIAAWTLVPTISICPIKRSLISWAESNWDIDMEVSDQSCYVLDCKRLTPKCIDGWVLTMKNRDDEKTYLVHLLGDASTVLSHCSDYYDGRGGIRSMGEQKRYFEQEIKHMEDSSGLRVVALARKQTEIFAEFAQGFCLEAIVGLRYSCQEGTTRSTIEALKSVGVCIKLVSHDEPSAVRAMACDLGIFRPAGSEDVELEGNHIEASNTVEDVEQVIVMRSCQSDDKLKMVQSLQNKGHVVAFLGGLSATDTAALKEADVGIIKETQSTAMTRGSCDIIIPNGGSLPFVLNYGRCSYYNIQKFTQLQLTSGISGMLINLISAMCSWDSPLTAIQLVWVGFVMCILGGLMMVMELGSQEMPITKRTDSLVSKLIWRSILVQVLYKASILLMLHLFEKATTRMEEDVWKSLVFNTFMLCQVFNQFNVMDLLREEVVTKVVRSNLFLAALGVLLVMQVLLVEFADSLADSAKLNLMHWAISFATAALSWGFGVAVKCILTAICSSESDATNCGSPVGGRRMMKMPLFSVSLMAIPFSFLFLLSSQTIYKPLTNGKEAGFIIY